jgi:hypothetical protein
MKALTFPQHRITNYRLYRDGIFLYTTTNTTFKLILRKFDSIICTYTNSINCKFANKVRKMCTNKQKFVFPQWTIWKFVNNWSITWILKHDLSTSWLSNESSKLFDFLSPSTFGHPTASYLPPPTANVSIAALHMTPCQKLSRTFWCHYNCNDVLWFIWCFASICLGSCNCTDTSRK